MYNLAKYLDRLIKPYIPDEYSVTSNAEFLTRLKCFQHEAGDFCISFDVVSLFTNIPLEQTINIVANYLYDEANTNKPAIPKGSLISLLRCATGGIFTHRGELYQQTDGVSMGNPLAPTLANFFMGYLECNLLKSQENSIDVNGHHDTNPVFYVRYVDDVFCIFREGAHHESFLDKLNDMHPNLMFTYEMGGKSIPFLDTKITLEVKSFKSTVFRKKTDTSVVLNYRSVAPTKWKSALIKWFIHRADKVCSNDDLFNSELNQLRKTFRDNGYPEWFFEKALQEYNDKSRDMDHVKEKPPDEENSSTSHVLKVPYVGRPSILFVKRMRKVISNNIKSKVRFVYTTNKVKDHFRVKDSDPKELLSHVVYSFKCRSDPDIQYIGYTNRMLKERVTEHIRGGTRVSDHIASCLTCRSTKITIADFAILKKCRNWMDTAVYEALLIKKYNPSLNIQLVKPGYTHNLLIFN